MQNIDKTIHYCWFGRNPHAPFVEKCIASWKKYCPDYTIIEWNEDNFDVTCNRYVHEAYKSKKWAFVTDYVRLDVLNKYGGIYLDTDVELIKPLDCFLDLSSFMCFEGEESLCTAVIGSQKEQDWLKVLIADYDNRPFLIANNKYDQTPNSLYIYRFLCEKFGLKKEKHILQNLECGLTVYPSDYFSPKNYSTLKTNLTENTHAIHYYEGQWKSFDGKVKDFIVFLIARIIGEKRVIFLKGKFKKILGLLR